MVDSVVCRPAVLADREAVLAIHDDVFEGYDYLPSFYNWFINNKDIFCYLAEVNGKVVSFTFQYITHGGTRVISGGGRTNPAFQRKGVNFQLGKFAKRRTLNMFPQMRYITWASNNQSTVDKIKSGQRDSCVVKTMNFLHYRTTSTVLRALSEANPETDNAMLTRQVADNFLFSAPNKRLLFSESIIKMSPAWLIFQATDENIKMAARISYLVVTKKNDGEVLAVSFGSLTPTPKAVFRYDVELHVESGTLRSVQNELCISHNIAHAKHAAAISKPGDKIGWFLSLPNTSDLEVVRTMLRPHLGNNVKSEFFSGMSSFVFEEEFSPKSML